MDTKFITKRFLITFLPLLFLVGGIVVLIYSSEIKHQKTILKNQGRHNLESPIHSITDKFNSIISDLLFLSKQSSLQEFLLVSDKKRIDLLAQDYLLLSGKKAFYDQVRYLDKDGKEIIRINFNNGSPHIVPEGKLQNKAERYYFKNTFTLKKGEVYISQFDLNIESGKVEKPHKPVIRFGTPVFDGDGKRRGIVLLNYLGAELIQKFKKASNGTLSRTMLLNIDGFWLYNPAGEKDEWGFMFADKLDRKFSSDFPAEWREISGTESGQIENANGLFTFTTFYPLLNGGKSSLASGKAFSPSAGQIEGKAYFWKIVSHIPSNVLSSHSQETLNRFLSFFLFLITILGATSWFLTQASLKRQKAKDELREAYLTLEGKVEERTINLKAANERLKKEIVAREKIEVELERSNKELDDFAAIASHDLQEPLRKITTFSQLIENKYADALGEKGKDYLSRMKKATVRMQSFIEDLLEYSRITAKAKSFESINLCELVEEVLVNLEARIALSRGKVEVLSLPTLDADRFQMRQLFQNLIANALKFSIAGQDPVIRLTCCSKKDELWEITLSDNGIGFDEKHLQRIFNPFERLHGRSTYEGTGMGLAICRKIVQRHGGTITAKSTPLKGATFIITLPARQPETRNQ